MRSIGLSAAVGVALLSSCGVAVAQGRMQGTPSGGAMHAPGGGSFRSPGGGGAFRSAPSGMPRGEFRSPRAYRAERSTRMERSYRNERTRRAESRRVGRSMRVQREVQRGTMRRTGREALSKNRQQMEEQRSREATGRVDQQVIQRHSEIQNARAQLTPANKDRLHQAFNFDRARVKNVNFDFRVGRRIPRRVRLFPIPIVVFDFFPFYRDYSYFVVDDDICIVDPRTYVVVDVIERDYWSGPARPQISGLHLTEREIALVRESIPPDFPDAGLRLHLALGAEIPEDVQLHFFPSLLLDRVPKLRDYRFLVSGDQIVIVQPRDRSIALVIDRR
jgi:hypothetical protein